jgi:hypothetical protein
MTGLAISDFKNLARDPMRWQKIARECAVAANYLGDWYDSDSDRFPGDWTLESHGSAIPMMVLYAAAVENLLKGIRVSRGDDPIASDTLAKSFGHHDLVRHAAAARLQVSDEQKVLLEHLRDLIESGKYPVAKQAAGNPTALHLRFPQDMQDAWSLLEYLEAELLESHCPLLPKFDFRIRYRPPGYPKQ